MRFLSCIYPELGHVKTRRDAFVRKVTISRDENVFITAGDGYTLITMQHLICALAHLQTERKLLQLDLYRATSPLVEVPITSRKKVSRYRHFRKEIECLMNKMKNCA